MKGKASALFVIILLLIYPVSVSAQVASDVPPPSEEVLSQDDIPSSVAGEQTTSGDEPASMETQSDTEDPSYFETYLDSSYVTKSIDALAGGKAVPSSQTGAFTYSYPIVAPPGTNGLSPLVSLTYNSQSANSMPRHLGQGWSLSENYIERDVNYTFSDHSDDEFALVLNGDAKKLVNIGAGQYRTVIERFIRIEWDGTSWTATAKDGKTYVFGMSQPARLDSNIHDYVARWYLERVEDTFGNRIEYAYLKEISKNDSGTVYPSEISYNNDARRRITFNWEEDDRPDTTLQYVNGLRQRYARRLSSVDVTVDGSLVRRYEIGYTERSLPPRSYLTDITLVGSDGVTSFTPTRFSYAQDKRGWDMDDTWLMPAPFMSERYPQMEGVRFVDLNRDGLTDILRSHWWLRVLPQGSTLYIKNDTWINTGSGWEYSGLWNAPAEGDLRQQPMFYDANIDQGVRLADLNGDGYTDLVQNYEWYNGGSQYARNAWLNTGSGWDKDDSFAPEAGCGDPYSEGWKECPYFSNGGKDYGTRLADVNGDGRMDILKSYKDDELYTEAWINNGHNWDRDASWRAPLDDEEAMSPICKEEEGTDLLAFSYCEKDFGTRLVDVNGDGLVDILKSYYRNDEDNKTSAWLNNGSGWVRDETWDPPTWFEDLRKTPFFSQAHKDYGVRFADVNGDGLVDLLKSEEYYNDACQCSKNNSMAWINTGAGWENDSAWAPPAGEGHWRTTPFFVNSEQDYGTRLSDVNGDGLVDLVRAHATDSALYRTTMANRMSYAGLMTEVTSSLGASYGISYVPSTSFENHEQMGYNVWVMDSLTEDNGMEGTHHTSATTSYSYEGGTHDYEKRAFRGFARVDLTMPDGSVRSSWYHVNESHQGIEYMSEMRNSSGDLLARTESLHPYSKVNGAYVVQLQKTVTTSFEGGVPLYTGSEYSYDTYGNVVSQTDHGIWNITGDERTRTKSYAYNEATWIVSKPIIETLSDWDGSQLSQTKYSYDEQAHGAAPVKGAVTLVEMWNSACRLHGSCSVVLS